MYYRNFSGVLRTMLFHCTLLLFFTYGLFVFLVSDFPSLLFLVVMVILGSSVLLWRSIYQLSRPSLTEYDGVLYYSSGLYSRRLGAKASLSVEPSLLGPRFAVLRGDDASITVYRSGYRVKGLNR